MMMEMTMNMINNEDDFRKDEIFLESPASYLTADDILP